MPTHLHAGCKYFIVKTSTLYKIHFLQRTLFIPVVWQPTMNCLQKIFKKLSKIMNNTIGRTLEKQILWIISCLHFKPVTLQDCCIQCVTHRDYYTISDVTKSTYNKCLNWKWGQKVKIQVSCTHRILQCSDGLEHKPLWIHLERVLMGSLDTVEY